MKYLSLLFFAFLLLSACKSENTLRDKVNTDSPNTTTNTSTTTPSATTTGSTAHYICSTAGCAGQGAGSAGDCSVCGNALTHNQAFHDTPQASQPNLAQEGLSPIIQTPQTPAPDAEPAQNASGVWHYTCSNGCAGGGGSAVACATCGNLLAHNTGYHSGDSSPSANANDGLSPIIQTPPAVQNATTSEPAQNAAGVWHYTCSNGCAGGGGSATACASCGTTLVHNTSYHN